MAKHDFVCHICDKSYTKHSNMLKHIRVVHKVFNYNKRRTLPCLECSDSFYRLSEYREHLKREHNVPMEKEEQHFNNMEEFKDWMTRLEKDEAVNYILPCGAHRKTTGEIQHRFYCRRSQLNVKPRINIGKKKPKTQGSCKIGGYCTSSVVASEIKGKGVEVVYWKTHHGHDKQLEHVSLPKAIKQEVAEKLAQGIPAKTILHEMRGSVNNEIRREHLIHMKDIHNIRSSFRIPSSSVIIGKHDSKTLDAWVGEMQDLGEKNPVIFSKQRGTFLEEVRIDDFVLVLMTSYQKRNIMKNGCDRIFIDSTRGKTETGLELTTLLVTDEREEAFAAAFCISNTVNSNIMRLFLTAVRNVVGQIQCACFLNDETDFFYNCWVEVMGTPNHRFLCPWIVDKAWQDKLNTITNRDKRDVVYQCLKTCQVQFDHQEFQRLFREFLEGLESDTEIKEFFKYFQLNYANKTELWAYCYRVGLKIKTNMHMENFYKNIKRKYLTARETKKVEKCIAVLKRHMDKQFDELIKLYKGKSFIKLQNLPSRHANGVEMSSSCDESQDNIWKFPSTKFKERQYCVELVHSHTCNKPDCGVVCNECGACLSRFTCTCYDYMVLGNMCKHIHAVGVRGGGETSQNVINTEDESDVPVHVIFEQEVQESSADFTNVVSYMQQIQGLMVEKGEEQCRPHLEEIMKYLRATHELLEKDSAVEETNVIYMSEDTELETDGQVYQFIIIE